MTKLPVVKEVRERGPLLKSMVEMDFISKEDAESIVFTCDNCDANKTCEWAFDLYNTNGDCLAEK